jgi:hypothetical protein
MKWMEHIVLYEDFVPEDISESLEDRLANLMKKKANYGKRIASAEDKARDSREKAGTFREKATSSNDPELKKIYSNRATEEQMNQQVMAARIRAMQMADKMTELQISTTKLKISRKSKTS